MKLSFALIRKEADTYRSQGRHEEALALYANYIACSASIDPGNNSAIAKQIQFIKLEMNCGDTGATQEIPADGIEPIKKDWGKRTTESDILVCAQDQAKPAGCKQKEESGIKGLDWADGMVDVYALVSNDKDDSPSENFNRKSFFKKLKNLKILIKKNSPKRKRLHHGYTVKSFLKGIVAFVLAGSVIFSLVGLFSESRRDKNREIIQKSPIIVFKKMPTFVSNENTSTLQDNGMENQSAMLTEEEAIIGDTQSVVDPVETKEVIKHLSSPTNDDRIENRTPSDDFQKDGTIYSEMQAVENTDIKITPEDPDPASAIDYVFNKRGL